MRLAFKLRSKWRILFVAMQILTMYPNIIDGVRYPSVYLALITPLNVVGLDLPELLPLSCLTSSGIFDYYASLRVMTLTPIFVVCCYYVLNRLTKRLPGNAILTWCGRQPSPHTYSLMPVYSFTLLASFCIFPVTSLTIFRCFRCDLIDDAEGGKGAFLAADYSIACSGAQYAGNLVYATIMHASRRTREPRLPSVPSKTWDESQREPRTKEGPPKRLHRRSRERRERGEMA